MSLISSALTLFCHHLYVVLIFVLGGLYVIEDLQVSTSKLWMIRDILSWAGNDNDNNRDHDKYKLFIVLTSHVGISYPHSTIHIPSPLPNTDSIILNLSISCLMLFTYRYVGIYSLSITSQLAQQFDQLGEVALVRCAQRDDIGYFFHPPLHLCFYLPF